MLRLSRWFALALAGLLGCAGMLAGPRALCAQTLDRPGTGFTATVASVDSFLLVLKADNGKLVTFPIEEPFRVPAGLVPGTRVTVRYEVVEGTRYRLVGVKIASGPIEHDSTTEPPPLLPASPAAAESIRQEPGTSPVLPEPQAEPESPEPQPEPAATPTPEPTVAAGASADTAGARAQDQRPARVQAAAALPVAPAAPPPWSREIATLVTLLLASGALLWAALARL